MEEHNKAQLKSQRHNIKSIKIDTFSTVPSMLIEYNNGMYSMLCDQIGEPIKMLVIDTLVNLGYGFILKVSLRDCVTLQAYEYSIIRECI